MITSSPGLFNISFPISLAPNSPSNFDIFKLSPVAVTLTWLAAHARASAPFVRVPSRILRIFEFSRSSPFAAYVDPT